MLRRNVKAMGIVQNTILRRFKEGCGAKKKSGSGRPAFKLPAKQAKKMIKEIWSKVSTRNM